MRVTISIFLGWLLTSISFSVLAQKSYRLETISVDDGLSQSGVTSLVQDKFGYLWIGTQDGLNRYDGQEIKIYRHSSEDSTSIPINYINKVFLDKDENLWVASKGIISRYDPSTDGFKHFPLVIKSGNEYRSFEVKEPFNSRDGTIVFTNNAITNEPFKLINFDPQTGKFFIRDDFKNLKGVVGYLESEKWGDWIFLNNSVLYRSAHQKSGWKHFEKNIEGIQNVYFNAKTNRIFVLLRIASILSLVEFNPSTNDFRLIKNQQVFFNHATLETTNGNIWHGTNSLEVLEASDSSVHQVIESNIMMSCIYETRDGVIWIGTNGFGLKKFNPLTNRFSYLGKVANEPMSLSSNYIDPIYTEDDNTVYVATSEGLDIVNLAARTVKQKTFLGVRGKDRIIHFFVDEKGKLTATFSFYGVHQIGEYDKKIDYLRIRNGHGASRIFTMGKNDYVMVSNVSIYRSTNRTIQELYKPSSGLIETVAYLDGDTLWASTTNEGIVRINIRKRQLLNRFTHENNDPTSAVEGGLVKCIYKDSKKNIWIGSLGYGLALFNRTDQTFTYFTEKDGLPNNVVYGILEDDDKNLWLSTNKGLCRFNIETHRTTNFDVFDGLQSNEFNTRAYFKSASGTMYFGGVNGLTYFHPKNIKTQEAAPETTISGIYLAGKRITDYSDFVKTENQQQVLHIPKNANDFGFDFVGISFAMPGRINYRYKLDNYDKEWHDLGHNGHVNFTNIPPGNYFFRVISSNPHGNWEEKGATIKIIIDAPLWQKPVAWFFSLTALTGLLFTAHRIRVNSLKHRANSLALLVDQRTREIQRQNKEIATQNDVLANQASELEKRNKELEKAKSLLELEIQFFHQRQLLISTVHTQEEERKRISRDLHDELGAVLSIARMHLVQLRDGSKSTLDAKASLQEACNLTEAALATMRRISHELMPPLLEQFGLIKTLQALVKQINDAGKLSVDFIVTDETVRFPVAIEMGLYRICMELVNNTIKHANAKHISINLLKDDQLLFIYMDDGVGLPGEITPGRGFQNIETRVNILAGTFEVDQNRASGFRCTVLIPMDKN